MREAIRQVAESQRQELEEATGRKSKAVLAFLDALIHSVDQFVDQTHAMADLSAEDVKTLKNGIKNANKILNKRASSLKPSN